MPIRVISNMYKYNYYSEKEDYPLIDCMLGQKIRRYTA